MNKQKKMTKLGGITIPKDVRAIIGIHPQSVVDIEVKGDVLEIKKHVPICKFCASIENIINFNGTEICKKCSNEIKGEFDGLQK